MIEVHGISALKRTLEEFKKHKLFVVLFFLAVLLFFWPAAVVFLGCGCYFFLIDYQPVDLSSMKLGVKDTELYYEFQSIRKAVPVQSVTSIFIEASRSRRPTIYFLDNDGNKVITISMNYFAAPDVRTLIDELKKENPDIGIDDKSMWYLPQTGIGKYFTPTDAKDWL